MKKNKKSLSKTFFGAEENAAASIDQTKLNDYSDIAVRMFHTRVLTAKELSFPSMAEFASRLLGGITYYRMLYFVNVLKIDMTYVTAILTLIGIYDVLNNPIMGIAYDKTRTRWGKARPYIMFATIPYFLSTAILFSGASFLGNSSGDDLRKIIFVFTMLFAQETFSTIYSIPRNNMVTLMSPNPKDRITVGLLNTYIGDFGAQLVYIIFLPLMELNNKGYINAPLSSVFTVVTFITATIGAVSNVAMAFGCKERIILQPDPAPVTKSIFYILKNKYARRNFLANFAVSWWSTGGYSWDVVTQMEIFGGSLYSMLAYMPYTILDPLSIGLIPRFQKLRAWDLVAAVGMSGLGWFFVDRKWAIIAIYAFFYGLNALNNGPANVFEAELGREINDYTEYMTGERPDGTINILTDLITKVTSPINALLTIALFKWSGYDTSIPMLPWSQGNKLVYQKVFFMFSGIGILPHVIRSIPYLFYDLVGEKREKMYIQLNERRALIAKQNEKNKEVEKMIEMLKEESR